MQNPKRPQPSLFALEQRLRKVQPQSPYSNPAQPTQKLPSEALPKQRVIAQAFDWDEAIELQYRQEAFPNTSLSPSPFAEAHRLSLGLEDSSESFEVEVFDPDEDEAPSGEDEAQAKAFNLENEDIADSEGHPSAQTQKTEIKRHKRPNQQERLETQLETKAVTVDGATPSTRPLKSAQPQALNGEEAEAGKLSTDAFDAEAFAADIEAILMGQPEPLAQPPRAASDSTPSPAQPHPHDVFDQIAQGKLPPPTSTPLPEPPVPAEARPFAYSHAIFDQMAENMAYANSFDLGTISLEQQFDEFDRLLDQAEQQHQPTAALSHATALNEWELAEDLALIKGSEFVDQVQHSNIATQMQRLSDNVALSASLRQALEQIPIDSPITASSNSELTREINQVLESLKEFPLEGNLAILATHQPAATIRKFQIGNDLETYYFEWNTQGNHLAVYDDFVAYDQLTALERELIKPIQGAKPNLGEAIKAELNCEPEWLGKVASYVQDSLYDFLVKEAKVTPFYGNYQANYSKIFNKASGDANESDANELVVVIAKDSENGNLNITDKFRQRLYQIYYNFIWESLSSYMNSSYINWLKTHNPNDRWLQKKDFSQAQKKLDPKLEIWFTRRVSEDQKEKVVKEVLAFWEFHEQMKDNKVTLQKILLNQFNDLNDLIVNALKAWEVATQGSSNTLAVPQQISNFLIMFNEQYQQAVPIYVDRLCQAIRLCIGSEGKRENGKIRILIDQAKYKKVYGGAGASDNKCIPAKLFSDNCQADEIIRINIDANGMIDTTGELSSMFATSLAHELAHIIGFNPTGSDKPNKAKAGHFTSIDSFSELEEVKGPEKHELPKLWYDAYFYETLYGALKTKLNS
jgi:hypothetical protein